MRASSTVLARPPARRTLRFGAIALVLLGALLGCGDREANEARLFLDRYDALEHPDLRERRARVDALRRMVFQSERVAQAQAVCGRVHDAVLRAEEKTTEARALLERMEQLPPSERTTALRAEIEGALTASQEAADEAAAHKPSCDRALADLRTRHAPSR